MELIIRDRDGNSIVDKVYQYHEIESIGGDQSGPRREREIFFVTGNKYKIAELESLLKPKLAKITMLKLDLTEIQDSNSLNIVEDKCRNAFRQVMSMKNENPEMKRFVLIEDTSLNFKAFNGLPGPYIKWFFDSMGPEGLHKMLVGFSDKSAEAVCTYALMEDESRVIFCKGTVLGRIVPPRGTSWAWDPAFEEERTRRTYGEMDKETKNRYSHRSAANAVLNKYLSTVH